MLNWSIIMVVFMVKINVTIKGKIEEWFCDLDVTKLMGLASQVSSLLTATLTFARTHPLQYHNYIVPDGNSFDIAMIWNLLWCLSENPSSITWRGDFGCDTDIGGDTAVWDQMEETSCLASQTFS